MTRFLRELRAASNANVASCDRLDQVFSQLQAGLVSSIAHMRKVFRDLDLHRRGVISLPEFRMVLRRHNLDVGLSDADVLVLMDRFPPAVNPRTGAWSEVLMPCRGEYGVGCASRARCPCRSRGVFERVRGGVWVGLLKQPCGR